MATAKRPYIEIDPDYEDVSEQQNKRRRILEEGAKEATKLKIESIVTSQFTMEIENKEAETLRISEKLEVARSMMDKLRACIVANYYANASQQKAPRKSLQEHTPVIHPSVRKNIGKAPPGTPVGPGLTGSIVVKQEPMEDRQPKTEPTEIGTERIGQMITGGADLGLFESLPFHQPTEQPDSRSGRFKVRKRIIVGNVSKSIPADQRDENDQATHKWMVYVRGPKDQPRIDGFVKKVWFFLHPSYRPNDLVEVSQPPFHLTRRGWGEFPVRVQLHFKDQRNKRLDIIHNLKLDRTYTGLQTLGAETLVDVEIERDVKEVKRERKCRDSVTNRNCTSSQINTVHIKQEPSDTNGLLDTVPDGSDNPRVTEIKLEPIDHDYGQSACVNPVSPGDKVSQQCIRQKLDCATKKFQAVNQSNSGLVPVISPAQTIVSPSVLTTQAFPLMGLSKTIHSQSIPSTLKVTRTSGSSASPVQTLIQGANNKNSDLLSPKKNIILQGVNLVSSANVIDAKASKTHQSQNMSAAGNIVLTGTQPIFLTNTSGNNLIIQTGSHPQTSNALQHKFAGNQQQSNPGLVFLKCTDNQGKTYLIPQPVCASQTQSPQKGGNFTNAVRVATPTSQPVFLTNICQTGATGTTRMILNPNVSPNKQKQKSATPGSVTKISELNSQTKQVMQNGPILFIKPDLNSTKTPISLVQQKPVIVSPATPVKSQLGSNFQLLRNINTTPVPSIINMKTAQHTVPIVTNQQANKGQLKVTSQGLIHVAGQPAGSLVVGKTDRSAGKALVNGDFAVPSLTSTPKQPTLFVPNNNKLTLLPGKAKSLLSPVTNMAVSQSNGNVILLNQPSPVLANGSSNVTQSTTSSGNKFFSVQTAKSNAGKTSTSSSDMLVLQTKTKSSTNPPNHVVIIPVTSQQTTKSHVTLTPSSVKSTVSVNQNSVSTVKKLPDQKPGENTMLIVLQNDKNKSVSLASTSTTDSVDVSMSSLLASKNTSSSISLAQRFTETQVTVSASNSKQKQIIVVNEDKSQTHTSSDLWPVVTKPEKKIITDAKKKRWLKEPTTVKETISPLRLEDHSDVLSLIRATVQRHPIVSNTAGRHLHPYCARSSDEWLSWNVGKRRASEWQRASSVRRFILSYLDGETTYKGKTIWTVKQILTWCRLHAYSPHYLEKPLHPTAIDLQAETSLPSEKRHRKFQSVTNSNIVLQEVTFLQDDKISADVSDDEIDIESEGVDSSVRVKQEPVDLPVYENIEYLPVNVGAEFVEDVAKQVGTRLEDSPVEPGIYGKVSQDVIFKSMELFMEDILRETFALQVNMGRYPDAIGVADVFTALNNLPTTDFVSNKYLGVEENQSVPSAHR